MSQVTVTVDTEINETNVTVNNQVVNVQVTVSPEEAARAFALQAEAAALAADVSEFNAATSASAALASEQAAELAEDNAATSASTATAQAGIATTQASNALASANAAAVSASAALGSQNAAAASASAALGSENAAAASASTATAQANIATTQAGNALISANNAAASAAAAAQVGTSTLLTGFSVGANTAIAATDSILQAFNKTQGQINARVSGTGTAGQVAVWSGASAQSGDAGLTWDTVNKQLLTISELGNINRGTNNAILFSSQNSSAAGNPVQFRIIHDSANTAIDSIRGALFLRTNSINRISIDRNSGNVLIGTTTDAGFRLDVNGTARVQGALTVTSNLILPTVTGTRIGTATNQLLSFWNKTPIAQPTTGIAAATLAGSGGSTITSGNTFGGYTLQQIAQALINIGILT
jgi:hypothetical protein